MEKTISEEKARIQRWFCRFNERGCRLQVRERGGAAFIDTIVAEWIVTRVAPHFDTAGKITRVDFWVLWKELGYPEDRRCCHTIKVVEVDVEDTISAEVDGQSVDAWLIVELTDSFGRIHHVEMIGPITEPAHAASWRRWTKYRNENPELFERVDASILEEHLRLAEEWK